MTAITRVGKLRALPKVLAIFVVLSVLLTGCGATARGKVQPQNINQNSDTAFDWKKYSGTTVNVMLVDHPWTKGFKANLNDFTKETGIKVHLQVVTEDLYADTLAKDFKNRTGPDVFMTGLDSGIVDQHREGLIESLTPFLNNPHLTTSDYNVADFPSEVLEPAQLPADNGKKELFGLPISTECYILFYNKYLVNKYLAGVVPGTMADLIADAQLITKAGKGEVFGSVVRGLAYSDTDVLTSFVYNEWSSTEGKISLPYNVWFKDSWKSPRLTDPAIVKGLSEYAALMAAGPPNRFSIDWAAANDLFKQGKAAFYLDASVFQPGFEDRSTSPIAGRVGYSLLPTGAFGGTTGQWSWGIGISSASKHKEAAWYLTQWFTDSARTALIGGFTGGPPRQSSAAIPAFNSKLNINFVSTVKIAMNTARPTSVISADLDPIVNAITRNVIEMAKGMDPHMAAEHAQEQLKSLNK